MGLFCWRLAFEFFFNDFEVVIDVFGVVELFCLEVSFEKSYLQSIPELYLLVLYHRTLLFLAFEVFVPAYCPVVLSSALLVPLHPHPQLALATRWPSWVKQRTKVSHCPFAVIEENLSPDQLFLVVQVVTFQSFSLGLKVVGFVFWLV